MSVLDFETSEYEKYYRIGEIGSLSLEGVDGARYEVYGAIASVSDHDARLVLLSHGLPKEFMSGGVTGVFAAVTGLLHCECPVSVCPADDGEVLSLTFSEQALVRLRRHYLRREVVIPLLYKTESSELEKLEERWRLLREEPGQLVFQPIPHGESFKVLNWQGRVDVLPSRINLGGGGLRLTTAEEMQPGGYLSVQIFLDFPQPRVVHAVLEVIRTELVLLGQEDRTSFNLGNTRPKLQKVCYAAGRFVVIDEEDRGAIVYYLREMHERAQPG